MVDELDQQALLLLIEAAKNPADSLLELYRRAGLHASQGTRAIGRLKARKMIVVHSLVREGRGARPRVVRLLPAGIDDLARRGIKPAGKVVTRGSDEHDVYSRIVGRYEQERGGKVFYERWFGDKAFDVLSEREMDP